VIEDRHTLGQLLFLLQIILGTNAGERRNFGLQNIFFHTVATFRVKGES